MKYRFRWRNGTETFEEVDERPPPPIWRLCFRDFDHLNLFVAPEPRLPTCKIVTFLRQIRRYTRYGSDYIHYTEE